MNRITSSLALLALGLLTLASGCAKRVPPPGAMTESGEPVAVRVQHVLIGFRDAVGLVERGDIPAKASHRQRDEAEKLALETLERARKGDDFEALMRDLSDDTGPGTYGMINRGQGSYPDYTDRIRMAKSFGDIAFKLKVGEFGLATYDIKDCRFGWHIIKRIE